MHHGLVTIVQDFLLFCHTYVCVSRLHYCFLPSQLLDLLLS